MCRFCWQDATAMANAADDRQALADEAADAALARDESEAADREAAFSWSLVTGDDNPADYGRDAENYDDWAE